VWFADRQPLQVALLERQLVVACGRRTGDAVEVIDLAPAGASTPAWQPAVDALRDRLARAGQKPVDLCVRLSTHFVRWQLLPWQDQLSRPQERQAYARLRLRATFGAAADGWRVVGAPAAPGQAWPACAVDEALIAALQALQAPGGVRLRSVSPYFATAYDHWRGHLGRGSAWFGAVEPGALTLGLLQHGHWCGLRTLRLADQEDRAWLARLPALQAQIAVGAGLSGPPEAPLHLAGGAAQPAPDREHPMVWHAPAGAAAAAGGLARMAWGI
jgi:hypothetical protein